MAFKEVISLEAEVAFAIGGKDKKTGKPNPTSAEGYYLGKKVVTGGRFGDSTIHYLQTAKGNVGIWGKTNLNNKLGSVAPGTMIRISHAGMKPTKNGDMHTYKVETDDTNFIEVASQAADTGAAEPSYEGTYDDLSSDDEVYADEPEVEAPAPAQRNIGGKTPAERAEAVKAMLARKSK